MYYVKCHHCGHHFDIDKPEKDYGEIWFNGYVAGYICPHCKGKIPIMEKFT